MFGTPTTTSVTVKFYRVQYRNIIVICYLPQICEQDFVCATLHIQVATL